MSTTDTFPPPAYHDHRMHPTTNTIRSSLQQLIYIIRTTIQSTYTPDQYTQSLLDKIYTLEHTNTHLHQQLETLIQCYHSKQQDIAQLHQQLHNIVNTHPGIQSQYTLNTGINIADSAYTTAKSVLAYVPLASRVVNVAEKTLYTVQSHVLPPTLHLLQKTVTVTTSNPITSPKLPPLVNLADRSNSSSSLNEPAKLIRRDSSTAATQLEQLLKMQTHIVAQLRTENAELKSQLSTLTPLPPRSDRFRTRRSTLEAGKENDNAEQVNGVNNGFAKPEPVTPRLTAAMLLNASRKYSDA